MGEVLGTSREDEEKQLKRIIDIAEEKLKRTKKDVLDLTSQLKSMQAEFDESDKEMQAIWHNTDDRLKEIKHELGRAEQARRKPYFGRIDFCDENLKKDECCYIGRSVVAKDPANPEVIDWRAPLAGIYYDNSLGKISYLVKGEGRYTVDLKRKRTYEIENDVLKDFYDSDVVANDELLTKYLAKNKRAVLSEIIATIQKEQNEAIRKKPQHNMIVQGAAGSGKTTVAMHRISYILYNYELEFAPRDFYIVGSNQVLLNYITGVLPDLNVYGVSQMTMEQLFVRLLYEEWDKAYTICPVKRGVTPAIKGTSEWFHDLEAFCKEYEWEYFKRSDVVIEKTGALLLKKEEIEELLDKFDHLSRASKIDMLTDHLMAKFENEIAGRYYSYNYEDRKKLTAYYQTYFGKKEWKGSVVELYNSFLKKQYEKGYRENRTEGCFDLYDLAALAYIYKRIKEDEIIREAGHVVIDEAQDFGMMAYRSLKYCLSKCTYTIMGDVAQNISMEYGLNDWQELRALMLPNEFDWFGLLQKSYRNTVEISEFATNILYHGSFSVYPVQPIIRHGNSVSVEKCDDFDKAVLEAEKTINNWKEDGYETIAVICSDEEEAEMVKAALRNNVQLIETQAENAEFTTGTMVLPLEYTKGLEFDAVLIFDASAAKYPQNDGYVKRLYVAATRALHELKVLHVGALSPLIATSASEEKKANAITEPDKPTRPPMPEEEELTTAQLHKLRALEGDKDMAEREKYGPARIIVKPIVKSAEKTENAPKSENHKAENAHKSEKLNVRVKVDGTRPSVPTYLERIKSEGEHEEKKEYGEFFETPDNAFLKVPGHGRIDCSVKMSIKGNGYYDLTSSYGVLRIMPVSSDTIRVAFGKLGCDFPKPTKELIRSGCKYKATDSRETLEISVEKLSVVVNKKNGAVFFKKPSGVIILKENENVSRQLCEDRSIVFFDWSKREQLYARRADKGAALVGMNAKYISFGPDCDVLPGISSDKGYEMYFAANKRTLCCNIPMYGSYICMEEPGFYEYYVKAVER